MRLGILILLVIAGVLRGEPALQWEGKEARVEAFVGQTLPAVDFAVTNRGTAPVHILAVESDCACTSAKAAKAVLAPGETAAVRAELAGAGEPVDRTSVIRVVTDDSEASTTVLSVELRLKDLLQFPSRYVYWKLSDGLEPKELSGQAPVGRRLTWGQIECSNPAFGVELLAKSTPGTVALRLTPPQLKERAACRVVLHSRDEATGEQFLHVLILRVL